MNRPKRKGKYEAVIFDCGGVLIRERLPRLQKRLARKHGIPFNEFHDVFLREWLRARVGGQLDRVFWRVLSEKLNTTVDALMRDICASTTPARGVIRLVAKLHGPYRTAMLTNHIAVWHQHIMRSFNLGRLFDVTVTSYATRLAKPDPRIYQAVLRRLRVPASSCVYIDDLPHNLTPARRLGMTTIHFQNYRQLVHDLRSIGLRW